MCLLFLFQIDTAQFSLEHPTQYFKESRELRGHKGGGVKRETIPTERPRQEQPTNNEEDLCNMSVQDIQSFEEDMEL